MNRIPKRSRALMMLLLAGFLIGLTACGSKPASTTPDKEAGSGSPTASAPTDPAKAGGSGESDAKPNDTSGSGTSTGADKGGTDSGTKPSAGGDAAKPGNGTAGGSKAGAGNSGSGGGKTGAGTSGPGTGNDAVQVVAKPDDIAVLVNKSYRLPKNYKPDDLVEPNVPFIFKEKLEKRLMRKEAAEALEKLFAAAEKDGVPLAGVSGFRSEATQKALFESYVKRDGEEAARKYSAVPGFSEHQTGLAMDVTGINGKCPAEDCFAGTKEAKWLADHAAEYGFIIRYPKGKDDITGYQYEPWHLRYVGTKMAKDIADKGLTLEEYLGEAVPVSK